MADDINTRYFRQQLDNLKRELLETSASGADADRTVELDQSRVGRLSRMDALQAQAMSVETHQRRDIQIQRIAKALQRLDEGTYGECSECGELIAVKRLEADPAAPLCIACANRAETDTAGAL